MNTYNITSQGNGDAFNGNKIINADVFIQTLQLQITDAVTLTSISRPLVDALQDFRENKKSSALARLRLLSDLGVLNDEALLAIASLRILLSEEIQREDEQRVESYSGSQELSPFAKELVEAAILKLIEIKSGVEAARRRFLTLPEMTVPQYVYLQRLATDDYVSGLVERKTELSDFILSALFEKTLELSMIAEANSILEQLRALKPLADFKRETVILDCVNASDLINKDYFCLSSDEKSKFDHLRDCLIELIGSSEMPDFKLLNILAQLFHFTQYTCSIIGDCLTANKGHVGAKEYFNNEVLQSVLTRTALKKFDDLKALEPEELMLELINQKEKDFCNLPACRLLYESGDTELIVGTLSRLAELESMSAKANLLVLAAISCPILPEEDFPHSQIEGIIENTFKSTVLNISFVDIVAPELALHGHSELAVCLYQIAFGEHLPWLSEPYFSYLNFLIQARQYNTVTKLLDALTEKEKQQEEVITLYSLLANKDQNYVLAASLLRKNIDKYQDRGDLEAYEKRNLVYLWGQYLGTVSQESSEQAQRLTNDLPSTIFDEYFGDYSWRLMSYYTHRIKDVAEKMIDWFCDDPHSNAKHYFNIIMSANQNFHDQEWPIVSGKYKGAFHYKENHRSHIKIVVSKLFVKSCPQYLIESGGVIAKKLDTAKVGDAIVLSVKLCTLADKFLPIFAAYHIASEIMDDDENEVFHKIHFPENPTADEIIAEIEKVMTPFKESRERLRPIMKQPLPIDMKYNHLNGQDNVQKALLAVFCPDVQINITSDVEELAETGCHDFVLDEMTAVYLACIGEEVFNECSWHMTEAVHELLSSYCKGNKGRWPVYHDSHYTVYFEDTQGEAATPTDVIGNLSRILEKTQTHNDTDLDIPLDLKLKLRTLCTENFLLSLALAEHLDVGMFCIDAGTRSVLRAFNHSSIPLKPDSFQEMIVSSKDTKVIVNLLWLNNHLNNSSMEFNSMAILINLRNEERLIQLVKRVEAQAEDSWDRYNSLNLVRVCLHQMFMGQFLSQKTEIVEQLLYALLVMLTSSKPLPEEHIIDLVKKLPIPLLLGVYEQSRVFKDMGDVRQALEDVTVKYTDNVSKAVRKNNHSASAFWQSFSDIRVAE
jgi:hypothetical protein